jgi:hypothetical protein
MTARRAAAAPIAEATGATGPARQSIAAEPTALTTELVSFNLFCAVCHSVTWTDS